MAKIKVTNPKQIINGGAKKYYFKVKGVGGIKGDKGDKGDTGSQGPQGPQGNAATIEVGSTTTLPTGYDATVTNTGTINNAILNFGIPRGIKGDNGAKGDKGDKGDKGEQGNTGPQGPAGQNATVYVGTTTTGAPGTQASVYNSGTDRNAVLNFTIPRGATGATGATGPQGPAGQDGQNFTPTIVETLPATGEQSKLYLTPKNYTTGTATGNPITISLGEDAGQITSAQLDGDTFQQTYTGKNLFNYTAANFPVVDRGITATLNSDGSITVTGVPTASYIRIVELTMIDLLEDGATYTISSDNYSPDVYLDVVATRISDGGLSYPANTRAGSASFTVDKSTYSQYRVSINTYTTASWGSESKTITRKFQLEKSASATSWEKYVGGVPSPNPDYPQPIQTVTGEQTVEIVGKNIFNKTNLSNLYNGSTRVATATSAKSVIIKCLPNTTYTYTNPDGDLIKSDSSIGFYPSEPVVGLAKAGTNVDIKNNTSMTFTTPATAEYMLLYFAWGNDGSEDGIQKIQIELGSTESSYAPYSKQTLPISLGSIELCNLGTYQDYIYKSGSDWKVHKATGKEVLNGSEDYIRFVSNNIVRYITHINGAINTTTRSDLFRATHFHYLGTGDEVGGAFLNASNIGLMFGANDESIDQFKEWLRSNNVTLDFALATPTDTTITDQTLIAQLEAVRTASLQASNTITNTATGTNLAGDLELGYYEYDPTNRYDKWLWLDLNSNYEKLGS